MSDEDDLPRDRPRERHASAHDIATELLAEITGQHQILRPTSTPPWRRKLEKWWLLATLGFIADHVVHEMIRIYLLHLAP